MSLTEQRFRDGTGERYLQNGEVRCQALSKGQIAKWRLEHGDDLTPAEELWPECQCVKAAIPGTYQCHWHGGRTPRQQSPKSIFDVVPLDLGEKLKILLDDPYYISRREDIAVMRARQWEILEKLQQHSDSVETWGIVSEALYELQHGNDDISAQLLQEALNTTSDEKSLWNEYRENERIITNLTGTEVKTAKELQLMATAEQVGRLMTRVYEILMVGANKYIDDSLKQSEFLLYVSRELNRSTNLSPASIVGLLESGSAEVNGDSE